jgi:hypothetical protein
MGGERERERLDYNFKQSWMPQEPFPRENNQFSKGINQKIC